MQKTFCDGCGAYLEQLGVAVVRAQSNKNKAIEVELVVCKDSRDLDICKYCLLDAIAQADDRPQNGSVVREWLSSPTRGPLSAWFASGDVVEPPMKAQAK